MNHRPTAIPGHWPIPRRRRNGLALLAAVVIGAVGVLAAAYVGIAVMLVGGIVAIVHGASANPVDSGQIAWGAVRVIFCEMAYLIAYLGIALAVLVADA